MRAAHTLLAEKDGLRSPRSPSSYGGTGVFLGGRYSKEEVIKFGGIAEASAIGTRSSDRLKAQPNEDAKVMERAQLLAYARDPGGNAGTFISPKLSIASIPNEVVVASASKLGVCLGKSHDQVFNSIHLIKELVDVNRSLTILNSDSKKRIHVTDDDPSSLVLQEALGLSDDL